jgi:ubiquitin-protein ligase
MVVILGIISQRTVERVQRLNKDASSGSKPTSTKRVSPYFTRYIFQATVPNATDQHHLATQFKVRLNLHASSNFRSPKVRKLSGVFKYDV